MKKINIFNLIALFMLSFGIISCEDEPESGAEGETPGGTTTLKGKVGEAVDLDLPSGKLWSSWNVGASSATEYGYYYAWGEKTSKTDYSLSTYEHYDQEWQNYKDIGISIAKTEYDVATAMWGNGWHIPTRAEFQELIENCTWTWIRYNNTLWGYKVEGKNGNKIFLPATGLYQGTELQEVGSSGYYWIETLSSDKSKASVLCLNNNYSSNYYLSTLMSYYGLAIRPVKDAQTETPGGDPDAPGTEEKVDTDIFSSLEKDEMVFVEGGTFTMGATSEQGTSDPYEDEYPTHQVTLSDFYIGKYEVTQQLWEYVMKYSGTAADGTTMSAYASDVWLGINPSSSYGVGDYYPAYYVSWEDVVNIFIPRLNRITGKTFRLPTEAEWEYAARGGNKSKGYKYSGSNTIGDVAWYSSNSSSKTHQVGTKSPNELGIYDMSGNVYEWCSDWYSSSYYSSSPSTNPTGPTSGSSRVLRGGFWSYDARYCRVSNRSNYNPDYRYYYYGFRLVLCP